MPEKTKQQDYPAFFRSAGIVYCKYPRFHRRVLKGNPFETNYYRENRKEFDFLCKQYQKFAETGFCCPTCLQMVNDLVGWGLFAAKSLEDGDYIGEYTGLIRPARILNGLPGLHKYKNDASWDYPSLTNKQQKLELDAGKWGNEIRYVNHSMDPNCQVDHFPLENRWVVYYKAIRSISPDEEITVDYGGDYWTGGFRVLDLS